MGAALAVLGFAGLGTLMISTQVREDYWEQEWERREREALQEWNFRSSYDDYAAVQKSIGGA